MNRLGDKSKCSMCGEEVEYIGPQWRHTQSSPRHPATPLPGGEKFVWRDCGCRATIDMDNQTGRIEYCALHKSAGQLFQACQLAFEWAAHLPEMTMSGDLSSDGEEVQDTLRKAIQSVENETGPDEAFAKVLADFASWIDERLESLEE